MRKANPSPTSRLLVIIIPFVIALTILLVKLTFWGCGSHSSSNPPEHLSEIKEPSINFEDRYYSNEEIEAVIEKMPKFPIPYPNPSTSARFPLKVPEHFRTWGDVDDWISNTIWNRGYRSSYFYITNGFAIASQIEQIDEEGTPLGVDYRWSLENAPAYKDGDGLFEYIKALFKAYPGRYRCIVFLISSEVFSYTERNLSREEAGDWITYGANKLPVELRRLKLTPDHELTILVYEFLKPENDEEASIVIPSKLDAYTHLHKSQLYLTD